MNFSDSTNLTGIIEDIDFLVNTNDNKYPIKDKTRNVNRWYYKVAAWIWKANKVWTWDDNNQSDLPKAEQNLIAEKEDYEIPTTALKIVKVEVLDNDGNYQPLTEKKISDLGGMSVDEYLEDSGMPLKYILVGKYIKLKPKPKAGDVTLASGLRLWVSREVDIFTYTDEAQEPGFAEPFHRLLSLGAAFDFASVKKLSNKNDLRTEIEQLKTQLFEFYGNKNLDSKPRIMPRRESII